MVFCIVIGCGNCSERDVGAYSRIPAVRGHEGSQEREQTEERRRLWLKAISRADLTDSKLQYLRVCWKHFVSGRAAAPWDKHSVDWVPTLHMGCNKFDAPLVAKKRPGQAQQMDEDYLESVNTIIHEQQHANCIPEVAPLPQNQHPRKLPNIPRNPEIYEPSPGIFKYVRKNNRSVVSFPTISSTKSTANSSTTNQYASRKLTNKDCAGTSTKTTAVYGVISVGLDDNETSASANSLNDDMSVELECYDEAGHNASITMHVEHSEATIDAGKVVKEVVQASSSLPDRVNPALSSEVIEIQRCLPTDKDDLGMLRSKLNRAMQLFTLQRRQIMKLSGRVKNLTRTNERLAERAKGINVMKQRSPCLATDTKYILLFENLINPAAMNTIVTAVASSDKQ